MPAIFIIRLARGHVTVLSARVQAVWRMSSRCCRAEACLIGNAWLLSCAWPRSASSKELWTLCAGVHPDLMSICLSRIRLRVGMWVRRGT